MAWHRKLEKHLGRSVALAQAWANMSLFEWLGDRIDNLSDENASVLLR